MTFEPATSLDHESNALTITPLLHSIVWRGGIVVRASDLQPVGRTFKS